SSLGLLSHSRITPFDAGADGFTPGDGCALFLLKRLTDARRDGDRVFGVLRAVGASNDAKSLIAPDADGLDGRVTADGPAADDCVGHGTFLAGLIAGRGASLTGVAPGARILALRGTDTRGAASPALVAAAVREATEAGADVIAVTVALPRRNTELTRAVADARRAGAI
ncbi:S8 family serine peptidase, partial [Clavibacter michiganensis]|uniref:S8 family serine peptidase n=1 Tax=Clavibacter michiganensis TaxID=28447 RepID=UPI00292D7241